MVKNKKNLNPGKSSSIWFLLAGTAITTLYFNISAADPFNTPKLIIIMLIAGWLTGHLISSGYRKKIFISKIEKIAFVVCALFLISMIFSTFLSDNLFRAFIGDTQRRNGFISYFCLVIIFLYAVSFIKFEFIFRVYKVAIFSGLIFSFYGLLQISGNDFVSWNNPYNAIISTVGNPNFASALMAVFTVISISSLFIQNLPLAFKIFALINIGMSLSGIILSNSRQGLVSLGIALGFYLATWIILWRKKLGLVVSTFIGVIFGLTILGMLQVGPFTKLLYKASISIRGYYWDAGIQMLKNNWFFGVGIDSYGMYFKEFRSVQYPLNYGFDITSSNAHNVFIQLFATGGLLVGLFYLFLIVFIFLTSFKLIQNSAKNEIAANLGLVAAWVAFQSQSVISIDNIGISVWGWLLGGVIIGLRRDQRSKNDNVSFNLIKSESTVDPVQPVISLLLLIPILIISVNLNRVETNMSLLKSISYSDNSVVQQNVQVITDNIIRNPFADPYYKLEAIYIMYNFGFREESLNKLKNLIKNDFRNAEAIGYLADIEASNLRYSESISLREKIIKFDPWNAKNYLALVEYHIANKNFIGARKFAEKINSFAPESIEAKKAFEELEK